MSLVDAVERMASNVEAFDELAGDERDVVEGARVALRELALNGSRLPTFDELAHARESIAGALARARASSSPTLHHFGELVAHAHELVLRNISSEEGPALVADRKRTREP